MRKCCTAKKALRRSLLVGIAVAGSGVYAEEDFSGHVEIGLREVDIQGDKTKYDQYINLSDGARLVDFNARYAPKQSDGNTPDLLDVRVVGLGGEPYESIDITVRKYSAYNFRYSRRKSDYFYEDLLVRPEDASVEGSTGGDFHHFDFERTRDTVNLGIDLTTQAKLTLDFDRYEKIGDSTTTLDVEREEFELDQPINEELRSSSLGFQYDWERVTLTLREQWQRHENDYSAFLPGFSAGSDPTEPTELNNFFLNQPYSSDVREHALGLHARPTDKLQTQLDFRQIDLDLDLDAAERAQGIDYLGNVLDSDLQGIGEVERSTQLVDAQATYALTDRWQVGASIRYYELDQDGSVAFGGERTDTDWRLDHLGYELSAQAAVTDDLHIAFGWQTESREAEFVETQQTGGVFTRDEDTEQDGFFVQANYQPGPHFKLSLTVEDNRIDDPFTLASATDALRYRLRGRYRFDNGLSVTMSHRRTDYENDNTDWESTTEQTDIRFELALERLTLAAGYANVELENEIDQLVTGGFRQDLFAIKYEADSDFWDASADFRVNDRLRLSGAFRTYENDGSFQVERDDVLLAAHYTLPKDYVVGLSYRNVDFSEGRLEEFDADIWEVSLRLDW